MTHLICLFAVGHETAVLEDEAALLCAALERVLGGRRGRPALFLAVAGPMARGAEATRQALIRRGCCLPGDRWEVIASGPEAARRVGAGDEVVVELSAGGRRGLLALVGAALSVRWLCPEAEVWAAWGGARGEGEAGELDALLALWGWSQEAQAFAGALVGRGLVARVAAAEREAGAPGAARLSAGLGRLSAALATDRTPLIVRELRGLSLDAGGLEGAAGAAVEAFGRGIAPLREAAARTTPGVLDEAWLEAELQIVERLDRAGRSGEAARMLREWVVNAALLAGVAGDLGRWAEQGQRRAAEAWLREAGARREAIDPPWRELVRLAGEVFRCAAALERCGYPREEGTHLGDIEASPSDSCLRSDLTVTHTLVDRARWWWEASWTQGRVAGAA